MKRAFLLLLPAVLLVFLSIVGCGDETQPRFTRIRVYPECGVIPMSVDCLAVASGGNESGSPTGGNNNLEINWSFGDGGNGSTSIAYHTFTTPGQYTVVATATDPDGKTASVSQLVTVMSDTLAVDILTNFPSGSATVNDTINFNVQAASCTIDPDVDDDYRNLMFLWQMNDGSGTEYLTRQPRYQFTSAGSYDVVLSVNYPALSVVRKDTFHVEITDP